MSMRETAECYQHIVVMLNSNWRVIRCPDGLQWILQRRGSPGSTRANDWRGRSYCRTRDALIRCAREYSGTIDPDAFAVLVTLPARIESNVGVDIPSTARIGRRPGPHGPDDAFSSLVGSK
jgi:hypothetical protein